jgi:hypothetical protein
MAQFCRTRGSFSTVEMAHFLRDGGSPSTVHVALFNRNNGSLRPQYSFKRSNDLAAADGPDGDDKKYIRTQLTTEMYTAFARLAEEWGSTTSIVLRRLMLLYISGEIEREAIWY